MTPQAQTNGANATTANGQPMQAPVATGMVRKLSPTEVQKLVDAGKTPRSCELEKYQAFYECNAYEGRPHFYDDSVPLQERKPCIVYPIVRLGIESNVAFAMGENRFPRVLSMTSEDDSVFDKRLGLSDTDSAVLDGFNAKLIDLARLEQVFRQAYRMAQASRSVAIVLGYRNGLPFADLVWSKLCTPTFGDPSEPNKCTRLEIRYRYSDRFASPSITSGEWWPVVYEYLRVIDDTYDTVYEPKQIWDENDQGIVDRVSKTKSVTKHGFGFAPVHWYARNRESLVGTNPDGKALHEGMCALVEQLDFVLSQRHRAAVYAGDPQTVITGASDQDGESIGGAGRKATPAPTTFGDLDAKSRPWDAAFSRSLAGGTGGGALRRGVTRPWRIKDPQGKVFLLQLNGDALKALDDDANDLASRICDGLGVVNVDPSALAGGGDLSGRTLAFAFSKQINRVSQDREDLGRCCILPVLNLFYRMLLANAKGVYLPGLEKATKILARFLLDVEGVKGKVWFCPQLKLQWGDYFEPSDTDEATRIQTAINAYGAKIITLKSAVEHVRAVFAIGNVDQYVKALEDEKVQRQQDALDQAQAMAALKQPAPGDDNAAANDNSNSAPPGMQKPLAAANPASPKKPKRGKPMGTNKTPAGAS